MKITLIFCILVLALCINFGVFKIEKLFSENCFSISSKSLARICFIFSENLANGTKKFLKLISCALFRLTRQGLTYEYSQSHSTKRTLGGLFELKKRFFFNQRLQKRRPFRKKIEFSVKFYRAAKTRKMSLKPFFIHLRL